MYQDDQIVDIFYARNHLKIQLDPVTHGLGKISCLRLFQKYYHIFDNQKCNHKPTCCYFSNEVLASKKWANMSRNTFYEAKRKLKESGLIYVVNDKSFKRGEVSQVFPTDKGWALYYKMKSTKEKPEKEERKPNYSYTEEDVNTAKIWFKELRKHWKDYPGKLKQIGSWDEQKEVRADTIRKIRERFKIDNEEIENAFYTVIDNDNSGFYMMNILGPVAFLKKWKNGKTAFESLLNRRDEIWRKQDTEADLKMDPDYDMLEWPDNEEKTKKFENVWNSMWDVIGDHLKTEFKTVKDKKNYCGAVRCLCANYCDFLQERPGRIQLRDPNLRQDLWDDKMPDESAYFYFLLDKYPDWSGLYTAEMLWDPWMEFWELFWRITRGGNLPEVDVKELWVDWRNECLNY